VEESEQQAVQKSWLEPTGQNLSSRSYRVDDRFTAQKAQTNKLNKKQSLVTRSSKQKSLYLQHSNEIQASQLAPEQLYHATAVSTAVLVALGLRVTHMTDIPPSVLPLRRLRTVSRVRFLQKLSMMGRQLHACRDFSHSSHCLGVL